MFEKNICPCMESHTFNTAYFLFIEKGRRAIHELTHMHLITWATMFPSGGGFLYILLPIANTTTRDTQTIFLVTHLECSVCQHQIPQRPDVHSLTSKLVREGSGQLLRYSLRDLQGIAETETIFGFLFCLLSIFPCDKYDMNIWSQFWLIFFLECIAQLCPLLSYHWFLYSA